MGKKNFFLLCVCCIFLISGCQTGKKYHDTLIETSLVCEIPTLIGNLAGGVAGVPFLLFSAPAGYLAYPDIEDNMEQRKKDRNSFILAPMEATSHTIGIILGTPFYPLGLLFPREHPASEKKEEALQNKTTQEQKGKQ
ncbi:MAG: hypothetical protein HUU50_18190 [Candidatus Brocadiae bacterium]|nr:hypothetical protein [Candidatus Brocadiia bacterium]